MVLPLRLWEKNSNRKKKKKKLGLVVKTRSGKSNSNKRLSMAKIVNHIFVALIAVESLSHVQLFTALWTAACQASLSFTIIWSCSNSCPLSHDTT